MSDKTQKVEKKVGDPKVTEVKEKQVLAKDAMKAFDELEQSVRLKDIIKDNKIEFKVEKKIFRVKKPNLREQEEVEEVRRKKYTELINDDSYLFRKQWIKKYKEKGIDILKMEGDMKVLHAEVKKTLLKMATKTDEGIINSLKKEVEQTREKLYDLSIQITDLLSYCIESQTKIFVDSYTACVILEVKNGDNWERYFKTYAEFEESSELEVVNKTFYYFQYLMYSEE